MTCPSRTVKLLIGGVSKRYTSHSAPPPPKSKPARKRQSGLALLKNGVAIDVIGQIGVDPGSQWGSGDVSTSSGLLLSAGEAVVFEFTGSLSSLLLDAENDGDGAAWLVLSA